MTSVEKKMERMADSAWAKIIARIIIPPVATGIIATTGWFLNKQVESLDELKGAIAQAALESKLTKQEVELRVRARDAQVGDLGSRIGDHEVRLRSLERPRNN